MKDHCQRCKNTDVPLTISSRSKNGHISWMCRECLRKRVKAYQATPKGKAIAYRAIYASIERLRYKQDARQSLNKAIKRGEILKPSTCSQCLKKCSPHGHHTDYTKPLEVVWLCRQCHADEHRKIKLSTE